VRARRVVVLGVLAQDPFEVALAGDEQPVQAFAPDGADPALGVGPGARCAEGRADHAHALGAEQVVERAGELDVAVPDEDRRSAARVVEPPAELTCLLGHPRRGRVGGAAGDEHAPGVDLEEEQHVQRVEPDRLDGDPPMSTVLWRRV
jgi:hypothetical protein